MKAFCKLFGLTLFLMILSSACAPVGTALPAPVLTKPSTPGASRPVPLATSRGDKLEASDPVTVKYGAGQPVLVEFFRFT